MNDIEIAQKAELRPIYEISDKLGIKRDYVELYGNYKAKINLKALKEKKPDGNLILVSALTPTSAGEGKTTCTIGIAQALEKIGKKTAIALREPSLGPVFGIKGGATGGGYSQVLPMEDINLHFTGDLHAVTAAHNLVSAALDNALQKKTIDADPRRLVWPRVLDMNDRSLRNVIVGLGGRKNGVPRETGFDITAASEIMATLCFAESYTDLKKRVEEILIGYTYSGEPITVKELRVSGAVAALLKDALKPNLVQSIEGVPAFIHGGPFANIAQGTNTVLATKMAMAYADYAVTEAGFGFDLGGEKFLNIKCRYASLKPKAIVLVATIRALKMHGGVDKKNLHITNPDAVRDGLENLEKHVENAVKFGIKPIVVLNKFSNDTEEEINAATENCCVANRYPVIPIDIWGKGGEGALKVAEMLVDVIQKDTNKFKVLYNLNEKVEEKILKIAKEIYGAKSVTYTKEAKSDLRKIYKYGYDKLAICMAKTQYSLSDNPKYLGRPKEFSLKIRNILVNAGAGFLVPISGSIMRMPGLPKKPSAELIDIDNDGNIAGLF